jgi:integrase
VASIRERVSTDGTRTWQVLYRHGKKQPSKTFESQAAAERVKGLIDALGPDRAFAALAEELNQSGPTLAELAAEWFDWKTRDLTKRAIDDYRRDYANWIDPYFGHRQADAITEGEIQTWVDRNLSTLLAPKTVADRHALLHGIYAWASARKRGLVAHNPCLETELPKRSRKAPKGLTMGEWLTLRRAAYSVDLDAADLILFMASTGWRIGEATALMVTAVEDGPTMYVTMTHVNRKGEGVVAGGKSDAAARRIRMLPECTTMLRRRMAGLSSPNDYVFTNSHSPTGLWEPSTFRNRWWRKSVEAAGLVDRQPTPHWLRHTHVMLCHAAGMSLPEIQRRLGHADIKTTINVYGRMIDDMPDDVAARLDVLLSGSVEPETIDAEVVRELG